MNKMILLALAFAVSTTSYAASAVKITYKAPLTRVKVVVESGLTHTLIEQLLDKKLAELAHKGQCKLQVGQTVELKNFQQGIVDDEKSEEIQYHDVQFEFDSVVLTYQLMVVSGAFYDQEQVLESKIYCK